MVSRTIQHAVFDNFIKFFISVSIVTLAIEEPLDDPESEKSKILEKIDFAMTAIFTIEAVLKIIESGFIMNGKPSYLRSGWNVIDFTIVFTALLGIVSGADT